MTMPESTMSLGGGGMSLDALLEEESRRLVAAREAEQAAEPATQSVRLFSPGGERLFNPGDDQSVGDYSLTSTLTDDFLSEQDFLSARSAVAGVDLDDAIQELMGAKQQVYDNFQSPSLKLVSTSVMSTQDLPEEIYLNKGLIRVGRSEKCDGE